MDKPIVGCYKKMPYIVSDDGRYGGHVDKDFQSTCGGKQKDREARENELSNEKKTIFCGKQEGVEICEVKEDGQEYQCYNCRKKELNKKH